MPDHDPYKNMYLEPSMLNGEHLGYLYAAIFGVASGESLLNFSKEESYLVSPLVDEALSTLTPREEKVIKMRFGLRRDGKVHSQVEVGDHFAVSRTRVRQIEAKALRKLRHPSRSRKFHMALNMLKYPEQAEDLELSGLGLTEVPEFILKFRNIRSLGLSRNSLRSLPKFINQLPNLVAISLDQNQLTEVPEILGEFQPLSHLSLSTNQLTSFPGFFFPELTTLNLSRNSLSRLPEAICSFSNLEELSVSHNWLVRLPGLHWGTQETPAIRSKRQQTGFLAGILGRIGGLETS